MTVIIANIISVVACTLMTLIGLIKEKKKIIAAQCGQFALMGISHALLGGIGGVASCTVSILRNLVVYKTGTCSRNMKFFFIALMTGLSAVNIILSFESLFFLDLFCEMLAIVATAIFTWYIDCEDVIKFKWIMIITLAMWFIYDTAHLNFVSGAFDTFTAISTFISISQIKKAAKKKEGI